MDYKMIKQQYKFIGLLLLLAIFSACSQKRIEIKKPIKLAGADFVMDQMHKNHSTFEWFTGKAKVDFFDGKKKTPFTAQVRMKRDSIVWISISGSVGIEGARLLLSQDSVKYINRIDKTYFAGSYEFLSDLLQTEIDFNMIQSLLIAKDFSWMDSQNLKVRLDNQVYQIESTNKRDLKKQSKMTTFAIPVYHQSLWISPESFKIQKIKIKEIGKVGKKISASYSQYKLVKEQLVPYAMSVEFDNEKGMNLDLIYSKISLNEAVGFPFSINEKYTAIIL